MPLAPRQGRGTRRNSSIHEGRDATGNLLYGGVITDSTRKELKLQQQRNLERKHTSQDKKRPKLEGKGGAVDDDDHNIQDHDGGTIKAHTAVVHVHQYEPVMPTSADPYKKVYCLRTPAGTCTNRWSACGINRSAPDGGPCLKQHVQTYRLSHVRKPVNFEMAVPRANVSRRSSGAAAVTKHTYTIHPLARQQIKQNTSMLPLEEK